MENMINVLVLTFLLINVCSVFSENMVEFYLYNNQSNISDASQIYIENIESLKKFKRDLPVRILIHGWRGSYNTYPITILRNAYIQKGNLNIIVINWKKANNDDYFLVTSYLKETAQTISNMLKFLNQNINIEFSNIYIIGHSLGAHLAGITGRNLIPNKIDTIFALDPARFLLDNNDYIKSNDAEYIETIHTNIEPMGVGIVERIGNADFYPNYGRIQEHCKNKLIKIYCNHMASVLYLAESINSDIGFYGIECTQLKILKTDKCECNEQCKKFKMGGEPSSSKTNGTYYLVTNSKYPFAIGKK